MKDERDNVSLRVADFDYELPPELIAQKPVEPRDAARMLVVHRATGLLEHRRFSDLPEYIEPGSALVLNDTRVLPARLRGRKKTGGAVEILLLTPVGESTWEALVRPSRRVPEGTVLDLGEELRVVIGERLGDGKRAVQLIAHEGEDVFKVLERVGEVPLPPYIHTPLDDPERYQTVYAQQAGSAAAPTAGLHFTPRLLDQLRNQGVSVHSVTLHVGIGTFRPVMTELVTEHRMHAEQYAVPAETARAVNETKRRGGRVFAVGTTTCRTLESAAVEPGTLRPGAGTTDLFIYPGYQFKMVDALITNFHLPRSSLLMLVAAFAGKELIDRAYAEAVKERYRFYSLGDAMLIL